VTVIDPGGPVTHGYVIDIPAATTGIGIGQLIGYYAD
jgi:hypothetical protein